MFEGFEIEKIPRVVKNNVCSNIDAYVHLWIVTNMLVSVIIDITRYQRDFDILREIINIEEIKDE